MPRVQVTVMDSKKRYKPFSAIVNAGVGWQDDPATKKQVKNAGIRKICQKRSMKSSELLKYFDSVTMREYDKEKIEQENAWRYAMIKHQKYKTGEWKKPIDKEEE